MSKTRLYFSTGNLSLVKFLGKKEYFQKKKKLMLCFIPLLFAICFIRSVRQPVHPFYIDWSIFSAYCHFLSFHLEIPKNKQIKELDGNC